MEDNLRYHTDMKLVERNAFEMEANQAKGMADR